MRLLEKIDLTTVLDEWMSTERYKLGTDPTIEALVEARPLLIKPLRDIPTIWYNAQIESLQEFNALRVINWPDWQECTGGTFRVQDIPENLHMNPDHYNGAMLKKSRATTVRKIRHETNSFWQDNSKPNNT